MASVELAKQLSSRAKYFAKCDDGFDDVVQTGVWNKDVASRRPGHIIQCHTTSDVQAAVKFGISQKLQIAVRGGGHGIHGTLDGDNILVIDLFPMNKVHVDVSNARVYIGGGARLSDVDEATTPFNLAVPCGTVPHTGFAGYALGGGISRLSRLYGFACDSIEQVHLVDSEGNLRIVDDDSDAELMWGIRGAGFAFGIVTQFVCRAFPIPPMVYGGAVVFPPPAFKDVVAKVLELQRANDDDKRYSLSIAVAEPHGAPCPVMAAAIDFIGPPDDPVILDTVAQLRAMHPVIDHAGPMSYLQLQRTLIPLVSMDSSWYVTDYMVADKAVDVESTLAFFQPRISFHPPGEADDKKSLALFLSIGKGVAENERSCFQIPRSSRAKEGGGVWWAAPLIAWKSSTDPDKQAELRDLAKSVTRESVKALPQTGIIGTYTNGVNDAEEEKLCFEGDVRGRLRALKEKMDPNGVFRAQVKI